MKFRSLIPIIAIALYQCSAPSPAAAPTTQPGNHSADWYAGWTAAGGAMLPATAPVVAPATQLTPLQRWLNQVPIAPGPYIADGSDLTPLIQAAKSGASITCVPKTGHYTLSATTTIPAGVAVYLNGSALDCEANPGASANIVLSTGSIFNGAHATRADTLITVKGRLGQVHNCYSDDFQQGAGGTWTGVANRFIDAELIDTDGSPNLDVQDCWIGLTQKQGIYITCNFNLQSCYFAGSTGEYDLRTEVTGPTNANRCQKATITNCTFRYVPSSGKGSTVGIRMAGSTTAGAVSITFTHCFIESNIRIGQQPAKPPWPTSPTQYANGIVLSGCQFVGIGQREAVTSLEGTTAAVTGCEFWVDQNPVSIAIAPTTNVTTVTGNTVHKPAGSPWHRLTNIDAVPGTGTAVSTAPYVLPPIPTPF